MGSSGKEIPIETQFLLLENKADEEGEETIYTVFLPLVEGSFRACLQGNDNDALELCLESGMHQSSCLLASSFPAFIFVISLLNNPNRYV